jgi:hypothetical protein
MANPKLDSFELGATIQVYVDDLGNIMPNSLGHSAVAATIIGYNDIHCILGWKDNPPHSAGRRSGKTASMTYASDEADYKWSVAAVKSSICALQEIKWPDTPGLGDTVKLFVDRHGNVVGFKTGKPITATVLWREKEQFGVGWKEGEVRAANAGERGVEYIVAATDTLYAENEAEYGWRMRISKECPYEFEKPAATVNDKWKTECDKLNELLSRSLTTNTELATKLTAQTSEIAKLKDLRTKVASKSPEAKIVRRAPRHGDRVVMLAPDKGMGTFIQCAKSWTVITDTDSLMSGGRTWLDEQPDGTEIRTKGAELGLEARLDGKNVKWPSTQPFPEWIDVVDEPNRYDAYVAKTAKPIKIGNAKTGDRVAIVREKSGYFGFYRYADSVMVEACIAHVPYGTYDGADLVCKDLGKGNSSGWAAISNDDEWYAKGYRWRCRHYASNAECVLLDQVLVATTQPSTEVKPVEDKKMTEELAAKKEVEAAPVGATTLVLEETEAPKEKPQDTGPSLAMIGAAAVAGLISAAFANQGKQSSGVRVDASAMVEEAAEVIATMEAVNE